MEMTATLIGAAEIKTSASCQCTLDFPKVARNLSVSPVPLAAVFTPSAQFSADGAVTLGGIGMSATGGVQFDGTMSIKKGSSFSGHTIANVAPLTPKITANGTVAVKVAGELIVGPGAATPSAGVIAGVSGELSPLDASFRPEFTASDSRFNACLKADAALKVGLGVTAKAWLGNHSKEKTINIPALNATLNYPGSPFRLPAGCDKLPGGGSPDTLLGTGVTKVDDTVAGDPAQWDHVDGFAPARRRGC
jgi:hypothetical protein